MIAAIYARVSTEQQDDAIPVAELEDFCRRWGWESRIVLVWKLDRFGRSVKDMVENVSVLDHAGLRFMVPQQGVDTDKDSVVGRFTLHILAAVAEMERSFIVERAKAGFFGLRFERLF
jgi:DNA invertase Pin-like site-specific DNA recombinase